MSMILQAGILGVKVYGTLIGKPQQCSEQEAAHCSPLKVQSVTSTALGNFRLGDENQGPAANPATATDKDGNMDAKTTVRLRELEAQKARAVSDEDYDEAKRVKLLIDRLKAVSLQLVDLEDRCACRLSPTGRRSASSTS
jgi:hypothetical protein